MRFVWDPAARADLRRIDRDTARRILLAPTRYGETNIRRARVEEFAAVFLKNRRTMRSSPEAAFPRHPKSAPAATRMSRCRSPRRFRC